MRFGAVPALMGAPARPASKTSHGLAGILVWACILAVISALPAEGAASSLECDREMRKTFEAIQAWRRQHAGRYPNRLVDLKVAGLLAGKDAICPAALAELAAADGFHGFASSVGEGGDPAGTYEYELSNKPKWEQDKPYLPATFPHYTRQDLKAELLRRPFFEQVPVLRCNRHRLEAPEIYRSGEKVFRNTPVTGRPYWDRGLWEQNWLEDVPYCARDANVMFGLQGPPFHSDKTPSLAVALDLRKWNCAFGDHPWWWTHPIFGQGKTRQSAPHLGPFFQGQHGRTVDLDGTLWWLDGLVQLQGKILTGPGSAFMGPALEAFVWQRTNLMVGRTFREAAWLQGTVWTSNEGEIAGWLVWHYADEVVERVPMIYGRTTCRFWGDLKQIQNEVGFPEPLWKYFETAKEVGKDRWLRLYQQTWTNPRPRVLVKSMDFITNRDSPAAPFIIAVNLTP